MSADFPHRVSAICRNTVTEALASISNCYYALRVAVPRNIVDAPRYDRVFALRVDRLHRIPYTHQPRGITTGDVVSAGREARNGRLGGMAGVLLADLGVVDAPEED